MELVAPRDGLAAMRDAFRAYFLERTTDARRLPVPLPEPAPRGANAMILVPGLIPGIPAYTVKVHAKHPGCDPAIQGVIVLHDLATGVPLAILESTYLTAVRTGLAGALGAEILSRPGAHTAAIIGAGVQGALQLETLCLVRPITTVHVFDILPGKAEEFAWCHGSRLNLNILPVSDLHSALRSADVVVTSTWAVARSHVRKLVKPGSSCRSGRDTRYHVRPMGTAIVWPCWARPCRAACSTA
jgi:ornithine cyclodeaminase/alanine dehydrogenase-like protein (mu-crystallin family)